MSQVVANCPRCRAQAMTFDLLQAVKIGQQYEWQNWYEAFCVCRNCQRTTVFVLAQKEIKDESHFTRPLADFPGSVNRIAEVKTFVGLRDTAAVAPPDHLPDGISAAFREGAACLAIGCYNAAACMFRLCVDLTTKGLMPLGDADGLTPKIRNSLGLRLGWLFENGHLPAALKELSQCIKDDGNDGAHDGTMDKAGAGDLLDFTRLLLERVYTEAEKLKQAKSRRDERRGGGAK